jgi:hypothetical protein
MSTHKVMLRIHELRERLTQLAAAEQQRVLREAQQVLQQREEELLVAKQRLVNEQEKRKSVDATRSDLLLRLDAHIRTLIDDIDRAQGARASAEQQVEHEMETYQKLMHEYLRMQEKVKQSAKRARAHEVTLELARDANEEEALLEVFNSAASNPSKLRTT